MKKSQYVILCLMVVCGSVYASKDVTIRPITIEVRDAVTGKPLEGISVSYILEAIKYKKRVFLFIKNIEPDVGSKNLIKMQQHTNQDGIVSFNIGKLTLEGNKLLGTGEYVNAESIYVNLDVDIDHPQ